MQDTAVSGLSFLGVGGVTATVGENGGKKGHGSAGGRPPGPPGKWANEKHTLAGTVFTREFNYLVFFRSRCFPFGFGVGFSF